MMVSQKNIMIEPTRLYRYSKRFLFLGLLLSVLCQATAQDAESRTCSPTWEVDTCLSLMQVKTMYGLSVYDNGIFRIDTNGNVYEVAIRPATNRISEGGYLGNPKPVATDVEASILAWQRVTVGGRQRRVLFGCTKYLDTTGQLSWATILLVSRDSGAFWWIPNYKEPSLLKRYDHRPTNKEIYEFLEAIYSVECRLFIYDEKGHYDWEGVDVSFIEGGVCEETWEAVIGEKPTKFFPGEKE